MPLRTSFGSVSLDKRDCSTGHRQQRKAFRLHVNSSKLFLQQTTHIKTWVGSLSPAIFTVLTFVQTKAPPPGRARATHSIPCPPLTNCAQRGGSKPKLLIPPPQVNSTQYSPPHLQVTAYYTCISSAMPSNSASPAVSLAASSDAKRCCSAAGRCARAMSIDPNGTQTPFGVLKDSGPLLSRDTYSRAKSAGAQRFASAGWMQHGDLSLQSNMRNGARSF